jgi:hypothetical protein
MSALCSQKAAADRLAGGFFVAGALRAAQVSSLFSFQFSSLDR